MNFEAVFLLIYADLLLLAALGLHRLGRVNPSPWSGRVLAGHRRRHPEAAVDVPGGWPHREQPRLHTGMALVAAAAGLVLAVAGAWRHHDGLEALAFAVTGAAAVALLLRLVRALTAGP